jgi:hypothetical protein
MSFDTFLATADEPTKQKAAEVVFRFAQQSVHRYLLANGDPHAGNYRFHPDGTVTFLDFGMVKQFDPDEWARLAPSLDAMVFDQDPELTVKIMEDTGFLNPGHGLNSQNVWAYVSQPYVPFLLDSFTYEPGWVGETLRALLDRNGPYADVMKTVNMPPSFVVLDRVVWGRTVAEHPVRVSPQHRLPNRPGQSRRSLALPTLLSKSCEGASPDAKTHADREGSCPLPCLNRLQRTPERRVRCVRPRVFPTRFGSRARG